MPMNFHDTPMGRAFFTKNVPSLIEAVNRLAEATEKSNIIAESRVESEKAPADDLGYYMVYDYGDFGYHVCFAEDMGEVDNELAKLDELGISRENVLIFPASAGFNILKEQ